MERALEYNFTTAHEENNDSTQQENHVMSGMMEAVNPNPVGGPMHGWASNPFSAHLDPKCY